MHGSSSPAAVAVGSQSESRDVRPWVHFSKPNPIQSTVHSVGENTIKYVSEFDSFLQLMLHVDS